jgi:Tfp pilus assembly protein PilZ
MRILEINSLMRTEKRSCNRIPSKIKVRFYCNDTDYSGTIRNISEGGMFISTGKVAFPFESNLIIFIRRKEMLMKVPVKVCRLTKTENVFDGMGVQVTDAGPDYLKFVRSLKSTRKKTN